MTRRSLGQFLGDAFRVLAPFIVPALLAGALVAALVWFLFDPRDPTATVRVGYMNTTDAAVIEPMQERVTDRVADDEFADELGALGVGPDAGITIIAVAGSTGDPFVEIRTAGGSRAEAEQTAVVASEILSAWFDEAGFNEVDELTFLSIESTAPGIPRWVPTAFVFATTTFLILAVVLRGRRRNMRRRHSGDLGDPFETVPVIGGVPTKPSETLNRVTVALNRLGRHQNVDSPLVAVLGVDAVVPVRIVELLEARVAAADSAVRLQPVRALSREAGRQANAVMLVADVGIAAAPVRLRLEELTARGIDVVLVLLIRPELMDEMGHRGRRMMPPPKKDRRKKSAEVIVRLHE